MNDESQLQVRPKEADSSLSLLRPRSGLVARGRRDSAILAGLALPEPTDALSELRRLAEEGDANAQCELGSAYHFDRSGQGFPADLVEGVRWWRKAAEQGHASAQWALGMAYEDGEGVAQDFIEAAKWYRAAAEQGDPLGQSNLGYAHSYGRGVPQDYVQAHMWTNLAAAASSGELQRRCLSHSEEIAAKMTSEQIAEAQQLAGLWKPKPETER